jgi:hypothetical protein
LEIDDLATDLISEFLTEFFCGLFCLSISRRFIILPGDFRTLSLLFGCILPGDFRTLPLLFGCRLHVAARQQE